jgi:hypothetical protein
VYFTKILSPLERCRFAFENGRVVLQIWESWLNVISFGRGLSKNLLENGTAKVKKEEGCS